MPEPLRIVATSPIPPIGHELFGALGEVVVTHIDDAQALAGAHVLVVRTAVVGADILERAPQLRAIARTGAGIDTIDLAAASRRRVPVLYAPDAGVRPIAEGTLALIFAASKRLGELHEVLADGRWDERYAVEPRDLSDSTLGIVGLGRIGSEVAQLAHAVGMKVIAYEPRPTAVRGRLPGSARLVTLRELFREADVISLHCNLSDSSRGMIDRRLLATMKPGAILVNVSRGEVIADEALLSEALDRGWLSAVGVDVFAPEPPATDHPLVRDPRVVCTPHTIGLTRAWNERVFGTLARDVHRLLAGQRPLNVANREALAVGAAELT